MDAGNRCWGDCLGKLLLRLAIGGLMLLHGIGKIRTGIDPIAGMVKAHNWPEFVAYGVYVGEVLAPALLIVGFWTRLAAALVAINMIVAVALAHSNDVGSLNPMGGWAIEVPGLYFFGAVCILLLGAGRVSIDGLLRSRAAAAEVATTEPK